jgi:hypothetical protein
MEEQDYHITNLQNAPLSLFHIVDSDHNTLLIGDDHGCVKVWKVEGKEQDRGEKKKREIEESKVAHRERE